MSIWSAFKNGKITGEQAAALSEVWIGQKLTSFPGGAFIANLFGTTATTVDTAVSTALTTVVAAIEAPVDIFLLAKVGAQGVQDANSAIDAQASYLKAWIDTQVASAKQNIALGLSGSKSPPVVAAPPVVSGGVVLSAAAAGSATISSGGSAS